MQIGNCEKSRALVQFVKNHVKSEFLPHLRVYWQLINVKMEKIRCKRELLAPLLVS